MYSDVFFKVKIIYLKQILSHFFITYEMIQGTYQSRAILGLFCQATAAIIVPSVLV